MIEDKTGEKIMNKLDKIEKVTAIILMWAGAITLLAIAYAFATGQI